MELEPRDRLAWQRLGMYRNLDEFRGMRTLMAPEMARCFSPEIHEGLRRPFGAVIVRDDDPRDLGNLVEIANGDELRRAADGVNTLAYCVKGQPLRLLRLATPISSQQDCSIIAASVEGAVLRVDAGGIIWVASDEAVTTIDDKNGWTRPSLSEIVATLQRLTLTAEPQVLDSVAALAYSRLSPHKIGTTLLYSLTDAGDAPFQTPGTPIVELGLNVRNAGDWPLIEHELRHTDGAAAVARDGQVLRKGVILNPSPAATAAVNAEGGTRHNSACRHSYDRPDLLAFVVSADGPVQVYSDGRLASSLAFPDRDKVPWNPSGGEMWTDQIHCPQCGASLMIRKIVLYGWRESEEAHCPICKAEVATVHGWHIDVGLVKDENTIARIRDFRAR